MDGKKVGRKLTALELVGPLVALAVFARECRLRPVKVWVDKAGSVGVWNKGYSNHCRLSSSVVRAISVVAAGLGCKVDILKVSRCLSPGTRMADQISKGNLAEFFEEAREQGIRMEATPRELPAAFLRWVCLPVPDDGLGERILESLAASGVPVLGYAS